MVAFSSDSLSDDPSMLSLGLFRLKFGNIRNLSGFDSNVDDLLECETEYSDVFPSSEAFASRWKWVKFSLYLLDLLPGYIGLRAMLENLKELN